jgi:hypothetical protein
MPKQTDILVSYIDDLRRIEQHVRFLAEGNEWMIQRARALVSDSVAQIRHENIHGPIRENETFMPRMKRRG